MPENDAETEFEKCYFSAMGLNQKSIGTAEKWLEYWKIKARAHLNRLELAEGRVRHLNDPEIQLEWAQGRVLPDLATSYCVLSDMAAELDARHKRAQSDAKALRRQARRLQRKILSLVENIWWVEGWEKTWGRPGIGGRAEVFDRDVKWLKCVDAVLGAKDTNKVYTARKPRVEDHANYLLYIMVAFLRSQTNVSLKAACLEIADFINASRYSINPEDSGFEGDIESRVSKFRKRNPILAKGIDNNPMAYVQLITHLDPSLGKSQLLSAAETE